MLFADDTLLMLSDHNLEILQKKVNEQMINIDRWFRKNKLSLNYSKTNFMQINKQPKTPVVEKFVITLNDTILKRVSVVKYLRLFIDDTLKWPSHINHLSLLLARLAGLFYRLRNFVN